MRLTAREAGERVGKTRQAIIKAIRKGTISAEKDEAGEWRIDPAELFRVYPPAQPETPPVDVPQPATDGAGDTAGLQREISLLRERIEDLVEDRDRWREQAEQALRLLTDQRPAEQRRGFFRRLFGR
jgi:hypothetical protein